METALVLLNYLNGPTRCLGVNAAIIDHIQHSPVMGVLKKQKKKFKCTSIMSTPDRGYSRIRSTVLALLCLFRSPLHNHELSQGLEPICWKTLAHCICNVISHGYLLRAELSTRYALLDEVVPNMDVFRIVVMYRIPR